jgi:flagellar protein FliO/FliZ
MTAATPFVAVAALLGVIALLLLSRRMLAGLPGGLAAFGTARRAGPLALEQVLVLDARRRLVLVRCGPRRVLLLTGGTQDLLLGWIDPAPGAGDEA